MVYKSIKLCYNIILNYREFVLQNKEVYRLVHAI